MDRRQGKAAGHGRRPGTPGASSTGTSAVVQRLYAEADRCLKSGALREAAAAYRKAIVLKPDATGARFNLGSVQRQLGQLDEAAATFRGVLAMAPNFPATHYNLALVLRMQGELAGAAESYRQAIALKPDFVQAHCNLGNVLLALGQFGEAETALRNGLALAPDDPEMLNNLATVLANMGRPDEAVGFYAKTVAARPDFGEGVSNLAHMRRRLCDWGNLEQDEAACRSLVQRGVPGIDPSHFLAMSTTAAEQAQCARLHAATLAQGTSRLPVPGRKKGDQLRLGYLSGDFREHPLAHLTVELFEQHDRDRFEVSAYSFGPNDGRSIRRRLMEAFDRFTDISTLSHVETAEQIRADGIDILIDLAGYSEGARPALLARRPAPLQVSFLGFPGTMGAEFVDYIIADPRTVPMAEQPHFAERIVHLPDGFMPGIATDRDPPRPPTRAECGLPETGFVFCCLSESHKLTPGLFAVWMRLLQAVPGSVLWLADGFPAMRANLAREAGARGIAAERLVYAPPLQGAPEHLARLRMADLCLDTLPQNGQWSVSDALWVGVPVVTCTGTTFAGRTASSLLHAARLDALVTPDLASYEEAALRLAGDPAWRAELRHQLEAARTTAPLFDAARFTRHLEAAFIRMAELRRAGKPLESFAITPQPDA